MFTRRFIKIDEDIDDAPVRILNEETNLEHIYLEQLCTNGEINRDPRMRVISTSYLSLIDKNVLTDKLGENAK